MRQSSFLVHTVNLFAITEHFQESLTAQLPGGSSTNYRTWHKYAQKKDKLAF